MENSEFGQGSSIQYTIIGLVIVSIIVSGVSIFAASGNVGNPASQKSVNQLNQRISKLNTTVRKISDRLKTVSSIQKRILQQRGGALPAEFKFGSISVDPMPARPGEIVTLSIPVKNTGGRKGSTSVPFKVQGKGLVENKTVTLAPGENTVVKTQVSAEKPGSYGVTIGPKSYVYKVQKAGQTNLEIYTWWTAGGEKRALDALIDTFKQQYGPQVNIIKSPVSNTQMISTIKTLASAGKAPDLYQDKPGYSKLPPKYLRNLNSLWKKHDWKKVFPKPLVEACRAKVNYFWSVPINLHTGTVWYNKQIFNKVGIKNLPDTWKEIKQVARKVEKAGYTPFAIGDKWKWVTEHTWELILAQSPMVMQKIANGNATVQDIKPSLKKADFVFRHMNKDYDSLTWAEGIKKLYSGKAAMAIHGDWAEAYLDQRGWDYGEEFSSFPLWNKNTFLFVPDTVVAPRDSKHPKAALAFIETEGSVEGQVAFNRLKGSLPARNDIKVTEDKFGPYLANHSYPRRKNAEIMVPCTGVCWCKGMIQEFRTPISKLAKNHKVNEAAQSIIRIMKKYKKKGEISITWKFAE